MIYEEASNRFDYKKYLHELSNHELHEIIEKLNSEIPRVDQMSISNSNRFKNEIRSMKVEYLSVLKAFSFFLQNGIKPHGISQPQFLSFRSVIESLVDKDQLPTSYLGAFE